MSMHTKEPWRVGSLGYQKGRVISGISCDFKVVAEANYNFPNIAAADAKRIVACVNACEGISNEHLEKITVAEVFAIVKQQRDELLAALKAVVYIADRDTDVFNAAKAAIAKAEGKGDE